MKWLALALLLTLTACVPVFEEATPEQLSLSYQAETLELSSDKPILRGSVGIRAASVESELCAKPIASKSSTKVCTKDSEGRVLLRLPEGHSYGLNVILGRVEGLVRVKAAIVRDGERKAVEKTWQFR